MKKMALSILVLLSFYALPAAAQELIPTQQRGLTADTGFQFSGVDNVNLFNGNLVAAIPLGLAYPVSPRLAYQLTLSYNSNVWDQKAVVCPLEPTAYIRPEPDEDSNAGLGWQLHLGRLFPPAGTSAGSSPESTRWSYNSADGGRHVLYDRLHDGASIVPPLGSQPNTWWTRDGTYLRMRLFSGGGGCTGAVETGASTACRRIEFADGNLHEFRNYASVGDDWRLTRIRDRFANWVDVTYPSANTWRIEDMHGRIHRIAF